MMEVSIANFTIFYTGGLMLLFVTQSFKKKGLLIKVLYSCSVIMLFAVSGFLCYSTYTSKARISQPHRENEIVISTDDFCNIQEAFLVAVQERNEWAMKYAALLSAENKVKLEELTKESEAQISDLTNDQ